MTITPVVVGAAPCVCATDGWVIAATPARVKVSAMATFRIAFISLVLRSRQIAWFRRDDAWLISE